MAKSTTENPADKATTDEVYVETIDEGAAQEAGIERASIVRATHVKYVGGAHVAEITAAQWRAVGIQDQGKVLFDTRVFRGDRVAIGDLTPGAIEYFEVADDRFVFVDETGKRV